LIPKDFLTNFSYDKIDGANVKNASKLDR